ncbi:hypothetical protein LENED_000111 [Lentinula edodes]|uniref:Uncharacterized protein n=1 Tax=Lentinula edodes TaxID=5353 RepID=A0A1Q3DUP4_LENED|nr:hypothetical protein LENED_000111 [Lentinula edodes]
MTEMWNPVPYRNPRPKRLGIDSTFLPHQAPQIFRLILKRFWIMHKLFRFGTDHVKVIDVAVFVVDAPQDLVRIVRACPLLVHKILGNITAS